MSLKRISQATIAVAFVGLLPAGAEAQRGFFFNPFSNPFANSRPLQAFGNPFAIRSIGPNQMVSVYTPNGFVHGFINQNGPYVPQPAAPVGDATLDLPAGNPLAAAGFGLAVAADNSAASGQPGPTAQPDAPSRNGTVKVNGDNVNITVNRDRYGKTPIARASETLEAKIEKDNRLAVTWSGDAASVARVRFILLDKDRKAIKEEVVTQVPATARFTLTNKTAFYQVQVEYINGTTTSVISPI
jgi:hypothetical protein